MSKHVAKLLCAGIGGFAAWQVYLQMVDVFAHVRWLPAASAGVVVLVVFVLLYFPLARPVSDMIGDRLSALKARTRSTRAGTGLDEVPKELRPRPRRAGLSHVPRETRRETRTVLI